MRSYLASALALTASAGAMIAAETASPLGQAWAQQPGDVISRILVENNQRIEARTVLSYLLVKPGDAYDPDRIDLSLKALMGTGLFADAVFEWRADSHDLVIRVIENAIVNRVIFEGNNAVTKDRLNEQTEIKPRDTFTRSAVEQDVQKILEVYRRAGRFAATVTPQYKALPQNRVDVIFNIEEGPTTGVRAINFLGNDHYSDSRLRHEIATRQSRWWRFFEKRDNYNPGQVEYDREQLRKFYTNNGYYDYRTISSVAELTPDRRDFYITYTVDEGQQYHFGDVKVETQLEKLSGDRLALVLPFKKGDLYSAKKIEDSIDTITFAAGTAGYANVVVRPVYTPNPQTHTIDLVFQVDEGPRVYIERIDITGNTQTLDRVIRREIRVAEGDAFNRVLLDNAKNRIRALGFFKKDSVDITEEPGSSDDRTIVKVKVEEEATGELAFSAGFSSQDAFLFSASATQRNFRGRGQYLTARIQTTSRQQDIEFRFTEPKFNDRNLAVGVDLFATNSDFTREEGFRNKVLGVQGRLLFPLSDTDQLALRYKLQSDDLELDSTLTNSSCSDTAFFRSSICDQIGSRLTSSLGYTIQVDRTNDYLTPTRGYRFSFNQDVAGFGGDVNYLKTEVSGSWFHGLFPKVVFRANIDAGYIDSWGDQGIRINDRFFKGANSFRGFDYAGLGPREVEYYYDTETVAVDPGMPPPTFSVPLLNASDGTQQTNDAGQLLYTAAVRDSSGNILPSKVRAFNALGGKAYAIGSFELNFPIPFVPDELGINGGLFTEFGTVGILDAADTRRQADDAFTAYRIDDSASLRASAGFTVFWDSPFGPVRFDIAQILAKEQYDRTQTFRFSTYTRF
ncbi:MAG: outer membrane protein assembly factor BamA [Alphaproteobacteria bacterium]|nr:outer membrane protein assembly factor BamA [Alphaproteobacteria bacterium]